MMKAVIAICVFLPFLSAILAYFLGKKNEAVRNIISIVTCLTVLGTVVYALLSGAGAGSTVSILSMSFSFSSFQVIYATVTAFMWLCSALLSVEYFKAHHDLARYYFFFLFTLGATMGVFLSGDLITTFIFFEIMSFTSYTWVVQEKNKEAMSAGKTYLTIAVIGGMVCLMGLFLLYNITGTLSIEELTAVLKNAEKTPELYAAGFCMLVGFGAKAGLFPLHVWLPKAHPVAPAPASALLSGVLTKTGIFGMLIITSRILAGDELWGKVLLLLGTITMVLGALLAVFSVNLKRTLACSSLSQIGFITVGVAMLCLLGEHNALAANGTVLYMLNHSIVKLVLFLSAGAIYSGAHTLDINKLRGYGRNKPLLAAVFFIGGGSLAGIPGFFGYIAKTLVHESIVEYIPHGGGIIKLVEILFLFSGGLTVSYVLKLFITIFVLKPTADTPKGHNPSPLSSVALILSAIALPVFGLVPHGITEKISLKAIPFIFGHDFSHSVHYTDFVNLKGAIISVSIGILVYAFVIRTLLMKKKDGERIHYNPFEGKFTVEAIDVVINVILAVLTVICRILCDITDIAVLVISKAVFKFSKEPVYEQKRLSYKLGKFIDDRSCDPENSHHAITFLRFAETVRQTTDKVSKGFDFALIMTCFGICLILFFILMYKYLG